MCFPSAPSAPTPPPKAPEAAQTPTLAPGTLAAGGTDARRRAAAGGTGLSSTILTSARGVTTGAATGTKTLLGQ